MTLTPLRPALLTLFASLAATACRDLAVDTIGRFAPDASAEIDASRGTVDARSDATVGVRDAGLDADRDAGDGSDSGGIADAGIVDTGIADAGLPDAGLPDANVGDGGLDAGVDATPAPDGPPPPPPCVPEDATTYGDITVVRQAAPAMGNWVRVAMVSWNMKDAMRNATAQRAAADKSANLVVIEAFAAVAKKQCVELLIFPEMAVVGYPPKSTDPNELKTSNFRSRAEAANYIEAIPAVGTTRANIAANNFPSSRRLADAAATSSVPIHAGLLESNGAAGKPYNTTLAFDKDGTLVARHRKRNVHDPLALNPDASKFFYEDEYLTGDDVATVYAHPRLGRVGMMTCADMYPQVNEKGEVVEPVPYWREKYLAGNGFSFMSVSSAWNDPWSDPFDPEWTAMKQVEKLSSWANPAGAKGTRWIGFANTVSNGKEKDKGFTALVAPVNDVKVQTDADKRIVIGYAPAP
jgi:predicted amidohydrolase